MVLNESSAIPEFGSSRSAKATSLDVNAGAWPGIASIQVTRDNGTWHMCSGALVSHRWVLTAASCFSGAGDVLKWKVVIGATDLSQPGPGAAEFQIKQLLKHPAYVAATARNNMALLELERPVECSDYIQLGCVPDSSLAVPELRTCYIAGWRAAPDSAPGPRPLLQEAKVRLMDAQVCNSSRWGTSGVPWSARTTMVTTSGWWDWPAGARAVLERSDPGCSPPPSTSTPGSRCRWEWCCRTRRLHRPSRSHPPPSLRKNHQKNPKKNWNQNHNQHPNRYQYQYRYQNQNRYQNQKMRRKKNQEQRS
ncbi:acrosin-like isoform X2 [Taeniopygia guttata]|uniref:acrosin-like isoform X2 n=1 Tax=Taeniopygia guttata TaxID=59729 RepID=UPI003BB8917A